MLSTRAFQADLSTPNRSSIAGWYGRRGGAKTGKFVFIVFSEL
jgi:hypothetical protein